jgi:hypothetical protein
MAQTSENESLFFHIINKMLLNSYLSEKLLPQHIFEMFSGQGGASLAQDPCVSAGWRSFSSLVQQLSVP